MYGFPEDQRFCYFKVGAPGTQVVPGNSTTKISFTRVYDNTCNRFDIATSRYYPPPGWNLLGFTLTLQKGSNQVYARSQLQKNGAFWGVISGYMNKASTQVTNHLAKLALVRSGDYFEAFTYYEAANLTVNAVSYLYGFWFPDMPVDDNTYQGYHF